MEGKSEPQPDDDSGDVMAWQQGKEDGDNVEHGSSKLTDPPPVKRELLVGGYIDLSSTFHPLKNYTKFVIFAQSSNPDKLDDGLSLPSNTSVRFEKPPQFEYITENLYLCERCVEFVVESYKHGNFSWFE